MNGIEIVFSISAFWKSIVGTAACFSGLSVLEEKKDQRIHIFGRMDPEVGKHPVNGKVHAHLCICVVNRNTWFVTQYIIVQ